MKPSRVLLLLLAATVSVGLVVYAGVRRQQLADQPLEPSFQPATPNKVETKTDSRALADALGVDEDDLVEVGGVKRPKRDLIEDKHDLVAARASYLKSLPDPGKAPLVPKDANPTVAKLHEELQQNPGPHPSKSTFFAAEPFDRAEYLKDPQAYLLLTRPGRVFQSAAPGEGVQRLQPRGSTYQAILQGESVVLEVSAEPEMPVTFHTQQLGEFDNRLKTITVAANEEGIAKVNYKAVTGVMGMVYVMAASPTSAGQLKFLVDVSLSE